MPALLALIIVGLNVGLFLLSWKLWTACLLGGLLLFLRLYRLVHEWPVEEAEWEKP